MSVDPPIPTVFSAKQTHDLKINKCIKIKTQMILKKK